MAFKTRENVKIFQTRMETLRVFIKTEEEAEGKVDILMHPTQHLPEETPCLESVESVR
jgi:hypothetical protein